MTLDRLRTILPRRVKRPLRRSVDTLDVMLSHADMRLRPRRPRQEGGRGSQDPPHLCLLAWLFPPTISGGTYRPHSIARYAAEAGLRVTVVAGPRPAEASDVGAYLLSNIPSSVSITHVPDRLTPYSWAAADLDGEDGWLDVCRTYSAAVRALSPARPDYVLASGPPFHSFVTARFLARRFGAMLILDYRDEWTECPFEFVTVGGRDRHWEEQCLEAADLVVFTTRSQRDHQIEIFSDLDPGKCHVVPNGWEPADLPREVSPEPVRGDSDSLTLSYVGNLGDHTNPGAFLHTLERAIAASSQLASRLTVRLVGQKSPRALEQIRNFAHPDILELRDLVSLPEAQDEMRRSSALLLLNSEAFRRYIPGKLYEYLASGRPVLVYGDGGEIATIVRELDAGFILPEGDVKRLLECLDSLRARGFPSRESTERERWLAEHTRRRLARRLLELLQNEPAPPMRHGTALASA